MWTANPDSYLNPTRKRWSQPELLERVGRNLASQARGRTTADMVNDYRALLPLSPHPIARFRVGIGKQTGLTEPYRHLTEAYTQTKAAYEQVSGELGRLQAACKHLAREFELIKTRWWRVVRAPRLVIEFREKMRSLAGGASAVSDARADEGGARHTTPRRPAP